MPKESRIPQKIRKLVDGVLNANAQTSPELRREVFDRAAIPEALEPYISKVAENAYKIVDRDIDALRAAGYEDDQIFELTICAAVGAGFARLERGLAAIEDR